MSCDHILKNALPNNPDAGSAVMAIMAATDKTQLSMFSGDATVHPLYLTLGNIGRAQRVHESLEASVLCAILCEAKNPENGWEDKDEYRL